MSIDATRLKALIDDELSSLTNERVLAHIRGMLVEPHVLLRPWDYEEGRMFPCWMVLKDPGTGAEIAYCEEGFGPRCPWGLVGSGSNDSMGPDSSWCRTFLDAFFESWACSGLVIWKVGELTPTGAFVALTGELEWEEAWQRTEALRRKAPTGRYTVDHGISYRGRAR